jgi:hypothetical protein
LETIAAFGLFCILFQSWSIHAIPLSAGAAVAVVFVVNMLIAVGSVSLLNVLF